MNVETVGPWSADWAWGLPLVVLTVMFHVFGLSFIKRRTNRLMPYIGRHQALSVGAVTLSITLLHGFEVFLWAGAFRLLGALPDKAAATLYSLSPLTSFGHAAIQLEKQWQFMGAIESLNGWILFGLSAAYLFGLVERIWVQDDRVA